MTRQTRPDDLVRPPRRAPRRAKFDECLAGSRLYNNAFSIKEFYRTSDDIAVVGDVRIAFCQGALAGDGWFALYPAWRDDNGHTIMCVAGPYRTRKEALAAAE